jgi:hypothetical protein
MVVEVGVGSYVCTYRVQKRKRLVDLGRSDAMTLEQARRKARLYFGTAADGKDPKSNSRFLRLHAQGIVACDFLVAVTATFRLLYVFVVIEHRSRRLIHCNVTAHPSASWTLQQLREATGLHERYEYLLHDRDSIFAKHLDESITKLGVKVLKSPTATHHNFNSRSRHRLREDIAVRANAVLGGLHHEYFLSPTVAPLSICG